MQWLIMAMQDPDNVMQCFGLYKLLVCLVYLVLISDFDVSIYVVNLVASY